MMGGDMANVKNSNLKVPPLKIVLSSATSGGSDRSSSTSPSSESESLDSNLTIISENQQQQERINKSSEQKKDDKLARQAARSSTSDHKTSLNSTTVVSGTRRSHDSNSELTNNSNNEQSTSSNQRITRSSQRAAQQSRPENETNGDETNVIETQDTNNKSANESGQRKVKRRKGEVQESEQDNNQQVPQQPLIMANIFPADYRLPTQNSFELYRDIRNRPYAKMMTLSSVQPKMPQGFKDYLLHSGPYLLDGNKVGVGVGSSRNHQLSYTIPILADTPKHLKTESALRELFQDQEKARHKMKIQHLKERERSVLSAEQEILRAYNRVAIANTRQASHLSACTYFYYQERYHYIDEKSNYLDSINAKDSSQSRENSDSCNAENNVADRLQSDDIPEPNGKEVKASESNGKEVKLDEHSPSDGLEQSRTVTMDSCNVGNNDANRSQHDDVGEPKGKKIKVEKQSSSDADNNGAGESKTTANTDNDPTEKQQQQDGDLVNKNVSEPKNEVISDADLRELNKTALISSLHEIDEKWAKIREEMFVRHKNESDSLYAVQCLEWEWKAKEIGACDIRLSPRIDSESVPRVDVSSLDY